MEFDLLALAFAAGLAAAVNPCGFALLPAYLAYFLGLTDDTPAENRSESVSQALRRAVVVSAALTAGFVVVFGVVGTVWSSISSFAGDRLPWVTAAIGVALVVLGVAMLAGFDPVVRMPKVQVGNNSQQVGSIFLFGVSYGIASIGCTLPIFLIVATPSGANSLGEGLARFIAYGLGMGSLIAVVTVAVALAREGIVSALRRLLPHMGRISGALLVVAGLVVVYSGYAEAQQLAGRSENTALFEWMQDLQGNVQQLISDTGPGRVGLVAALIVGGAIAASYALRSRRRSTTS